MLWVKAFHIIFMVTWFAGLFYLPRLFVYHSMAEDKTSTDRFKIMERKLFYGIMTPGGVLTVATGLWMLLGDAGAWLLTQQWMWLKLALVAGLIAYHIFCGVLVAHFKADNQKHGHVWYRWFNEIPVLFLVLIILLVTLRP